MPNSIALFLSHGQEQRATRNGPVLTVDIRINQGPGDKKADVERLYSKANQQISNLCVATHQRS